jgi:hypothetical protein
VRVTVSSQPSALSRISRPRDLVIANRELILTCNSHDVTLHATLSGRAATIRSVAGVLGATNGRTNGADL